MPGKYHQFRWLILSFCFIIFIGGPAFSKEQQYHKIMLAVVNQTPVYQDDLINEVGLLGKQLFSSQAAINNHSFNKKSEKNFKSLVLENIIDSILLSQEADKLKIKVTAASINKQYAAINKRLSKDPDYNLSKEALKIQIRKGLAIEQLLEKKVIHKIRILETEKIKYFKERRLEFKQPAQVRVRHLMIKINSFADDPDKARAKALKKIKKIQNRLQDNENFSALAIEFSDDPSKTKGGDIGFFSRAQVVKSFGDAAFALMPGETSSIIETQFGYHLIQSIAKKPEIFLTYDQAEDDIEKLLFNQQKNQQIKAFVNQLRATAVIEKYLF